MDTTAIELKSYQELVIDQETGEEVVADKFLYLPGRPREYRFNGQNGQFNLYGDRILMDKNGKAVSSFSFQPISYRFFEDALFGRAQMESWAELFFVDEQNCVSSIMFNSTSVIELSRLMEPLHYEKISLSEVILTAKPEYVRSKSDPSKAWYLARFSYELADKAATQMYRDYVNDVPVYRLETITPHGDMRAMSRAFARVLDKEAHQAYHGIPKPEDVMAIAETAA